MKEHEFYCSKADEFLDSVEKYIIETQGEFPTEYRISMMMLRNNLVYYMKSYDSVVDNGVVYEDSHGKQFVSQMWRVLQDTEKRIVELLRQFGLTTMSRSKIKINERAMTPDQFLASLLENE